MKLSKKSTKSMRSKISHQYDQFIYFTNTCEKEIDLQMYHRIAFEIPFKVYDYVNHISIINIL